MHRSPESIPIGDPPPDPAVGASWDHRRVPKTPRRTQQERSAESSERLLQAAIELFAERGYERTTIAAIGRRAGYSHSMVTARYGSKEQLLEALVATQYEPRLLAEPDPQATGREQLLAQLDLGIVQLRERPEIMRAFFVLIFEIAGPISGFKPWAVQWLERYEQAAVRALRKGQRDGSLVLTASPRVVGKQFVALLIGLAFRWVLDPDGIDYTADLKALRRRIATSGVPT